jgi:hypothetical protein
MVWWVVLVPTQLALPELAVRWGLAGSRGEGDHRDLNTGMSCGAVVGLPRLGVSGMRDGLARVYTNLQRSRLQPLALSLTRDSTRPRNSIFSRCSDDAVGCCDWAGSAADLRHRAVAQAVSASRGRSFVGSRVPCSHCNFEPSAVCKARLRTGL